MGEIGGGLAGLRLPSDAIQAGHNSATWTYGQELIGGGQCVEIGLGIGRNTITRKIQELHIEA